jgi:hypothetical protein
MHDVIYQRQTSAATAARHARNLVAAAPVAWNSLDEIRQLRAPVHWISSIIVRHIESFCVQRYQYERKNDG